MKSHVKVLSIAALTIVGASLSHANASGYGQGYVSASFTESGPGIYLTSTTGTYLSVDYMSFVGTSWVSVDYWGGSSTTPTNPVFVNNYGESFSGPTIGGSGVLVEKEAVDILTFTNTSALNDTLGIGAYTFGYGSGYAATWNDYGFGYGAGEVYDSSGAILQYSEGYGQNLGFGDGGLYAYAYNYDPYNGLVGVSASGGNIFPGTYIGEADDLEGYSLTLAPGATDTFTFVTLNEHEAYSITPGPAAVAPFALGLIGALRRRRKQ